MNKCKQNQGMSLVYIKQHLEFVILLIIMTDTQISVDNWKCITDVF